MNGDVRYMFIFVATAEYFLLSCKTELPDLYVYKEAKYKYITDVPMGATDICYSVCLTVGDRKLK